MVPSSQHSLHASKMAAASGFRSLARRSYNMCTRRVGSIEVLPEVKMLWRHLMTSSQVQAIATTQILMPALSPTMEEGTIVTWLKKEGDAIAPGDALCEIETDKATITMDTDEEGILAKIIIPSGSKNIKVNELIALIVDEDEDYTKVEVPVMSQVLPAGDLGTSSNESPGLETGTLGSDVPLSPAVRLLLETNSLDPRLIPATGPGGRILKGDILKFVAQGGRPGERVRRPADTPPPQVTVSMSTKPQVASPVPVEREPQPVAKAPDLVEVSYTDIPNTGMRSVIAKRLTESKSTIPHVYASADCFMDNLVQLRSHLKDRHMKVSVNDLIVKIVAITLGQVPEMNSIWTGDEPQQLDEIDVAVAVATDGGLITPVVRDAANLDLSQISVVLKDLAARAREGKLQLHEFQGGSFTISNLGMFGITEFSAVINPPQASILAVGGTRLTLTADELLHKVMTVTLSCDGRIVDNELASRWLEAFKTNIENPALIGL